MHKEKLPTLGNKSKEEQLIQQGQILLNHVENCLLEITVLEAKLALQGIKINLDDYEALKKVIAEDGEYKLLIQKIEDELKEARINPEKSLEILKKFDENGEYKRKLSKIEKELDTVTKNHPFNQVEITIGELK